MSMTFTKLFSSITESSIWCEDNETRIVWIAMLAMADRRGRVWASIPGLANRSRVPVASAQKAIEKFLGPDPFSRTPDNEGRRIEVIDGGWRLLNYQKYRDIRDEESIKESKRNYINRVRAEKKQSQVLNNQECGENVENVERGRYNAEAEAEAEADNNTNTRARTPAENVEIRRQRMIDARKKGTHTQAEWLALFNIHGGKCVSCGSEDEICKDHIKPIYQGGSDGIENIQPMCRSCNSAKGPKDEDLRISNWRELLSVEIAKPTAQQQAEFIYEAYPRREAKKTAVAAIQKAMKKEPWERLLELTKEYAVIVAHEEKQYIPMPATWFNQERYLDNEAVKIRLSEKKNGHSFDAQPDKPKSVYELTKIIEAKETLAKSIRNRHTYEAASGVEWSNDAKRQEYRTLKAEIKTLTEQLAKG